MTRGTDLSDGKARQRELEVARDEAAEARERLILAKLAERFPDRPPAYTQLRGAPRLRGTLVRA